MTNKSNILLPNEIIRNIISYKKPIEYVPENVDVFKMTLKLDPSVSYINISYGLNYEKTIYPMYDFFYICNKILINNFEVEPNLCRYPCIIRESYLIWTKHVLACVSYKYGLNTEFQFDYTRVDEPIAKQKLYTEYLESINNMELEYSSLAKSQERRFKAVLNYLPFLFSLRSSRIHTIKKKIFYDKIIIASYTVYNTKEEENLILGDYFSCFHSDHTTGIFDRNMITFRFENKIQRRTFKNFHQAFRHTIYEHEDNDLLCGFNNPIPNSYKL